MRRGEGGLRQLVGRGLVVADFLEVGLRAHLVQRALQKQFVGRNARDVEAARGHEINLVGGGREVVLPFAGIFEIGGNALARLAEVERRRRGFPEPFPRTATGKASGQSAPSRCAGRFSRAAAPRRSHRRSARAHRPSTGQGHRWAESPRDRRLSAAPAWSGPGQTALVRRPSMRRRRPLSRGRQKGDETQDELQQAALGHGGTPCDQITRRGETLGAMGAT